MKQRDLIYSDTITIRVTEQMHETIDELAEVDERTLSKMTKILLREALQSRGKDVQ